MGSATALSILSYSDCCRCFQQSRGSCQIGYRSGGSIPSPVSSLLPLRQAKHTGCSRAARPTVVCLRNSSRTTAVTWKSWDKLVLKNESPVLVEFYASWCGPCQMVHRAINEIASEYRGKLNCFVLNTDNDLAVAEEYDIKAVPVVLLFKNGEKRDSIVGTMPKEFYVAAVEKVLAS